ncbi:hypothetical protein R6Q59_018928 [Mikania micrantha]
MDRDFYCTNDMISGKWRDLQRKIAKFNGIWIQHHNSRKSGENDETVVRKSTKWHHVPQLQTSKRTKTSLSGKYTTTQSDSTGRFFLNLNESDKEVEMDLPPPSPQRLAGRNNKGKRPQVSSSTDYKDTLETISESFQNFVDLQEQEQYNNDMKLLWTPTDHLTDRAREMTEKTNEQIMKRYNMD